MATTLTKLEWIEILQNRSISIDFDIKMFQGLYSFEGHKAAASEIGRLLGFNGKNPSAPLNSEIGRYAKRIAKHYEINFTERASKQYKYWDLFFNGWQEGSLFIWELRAELREALEESGLTGDEYFAEEIHSEDLPDLVEGFKKTIIVNTYERNSKARETCVKFWKPVCVICDFYFGKKYGQLGVGFIHVHHLTPVSEIGKSYFIDPIEDLRPVCPNCHAMLHRKSPPYSIEELKTIWIDNNTFN